MQDSEAKHSLASRIIKTEPTDWRSFHFIQKGDFKELSSVASEKLKNSILKNEFTQPFYVWHDEYTGKVYCLDGKHRVDILNQLIGEGHTIPDRLPATFIRCADKQEAAGLVLIYSSIYATVTEQGLFDFIQMYELEYADFKDTIDLPGFDDIEFQSMLKDATESTGGKVIPVSLVEKFIIPPFSVLDSRQGYWQDRKKKWNDLFDSQATREDIEIISKTGQAPAIYELRNKMREKIGRDPEWDEILEYAEKKGLHVYGGASMFDPVLAEVAYTWFCPPGGIVLDPFAGGSVRGIVAGLLGLNYHGIDLRPDQVAANRQQAEKLNVTGARWYTGDSNEMDCILPKDLLADFIFSCPPYHDLQKYSDDPADLSNMDYYAFCDVYRAIITKSMDRLKENRFACFVVGDIRDKQGYYRNFIQETIDCFTKCYGSTGRVKLYNEIILVNVAGSLPVRINRQFGTYRKVGKMHQNVLVFYKGDAKKIKDEFPEIKVVEDLQGLDNQPNIAMSYN
jgi:DNA modification methylase